MNKVDYERFNQFCHKMSELNLTMDFFEIEKLVRQLHRCEVTLSRLAEQDCNFGLTLKEDQKERNTWKKVREIVFKIHPLIIVRENGDPRGCIIELHLPDGSYNYADGESWRIIW